MFFFLFDEWSVIDVYHKHSCTKILYRKSIVEEEEKEKEKKEERGEWVVFANPNFFFLQLVCWSQDSLHFIHWTSFLSIASYQSQFNSFYSFFFFLILSQFWQFIWKHTAGENSCKSWEKNFFNNLLLQLLKFRISCKKKRTILIKLSCVKKNGRRNNIQ